MSATPENMSKAIGEADRLVLAAMQGYLRTCRSGGMPRALSDKIEAAVRQAADLQYFSVVIAEAAQPELKSK